MNNLPNVDENKVTLTIMPVSENIEEIHFF